MHPFPQATDFNFLIGAELEQVCLGQWQIQLNFDKARIFVEGELEHVEKSGNLHRHNTDVDRLSPIFLHRLFGQKIHSIEAEPFCLSLAFNDGDIIRILSDDGPYECGQIYDRAGHLTVF